jgi:cob(I)alamin adenosyltransferase
MSITAAKREKGLTSLLGGDRVPKHHIKPETFGTLDELNSFIGMARAVTRRRTIKKSLFTIQNHLFIMCSELALGHGDRSLLKGEITEKEVNWLIQLTIDFKTLLNLGPKFVIYGETLSSSVLDVARAVSRRAERQVERMKSKKMLHNLRTSDYLNRLSEVLYLFARYEDKSAGVRPKNPTYGA